MGPAVDAWHMVAAEAWALLWSGRLRALVRVVCCAYKYLLATSYVCVVCVVCCRQAPCLKRFKRLRLILYRGS
jgi:hypothetical protein